MAAAELCRQKLPLIPGGAVVPYIFTRQFIEAKAHIGLLGRAADPQIGPVDRVAPKLDARSEETIPADLVVCRGVVVVRLRRDHASIDPAFLLDPVLRLPVIGVAEHSDDADAGAADIPAIPAAEIRTPVGGNGMIDLDKIGLCILEALSDALQLRRREIRAIDTLASSKCFAQLTRHLANTVVEPEAVRFAAIIGVACLETRFRVGADADTNLEEGVIRKVERGKLDNPSAELPRKLG